MDSFHANSRPVYVYPVQNTALSQVLLDMGTSLYGNPNTMPLLPQFQLQQQQQQQQQQQLINSMVASSMNSIGGIVGIGVPLLVYCPSYNGGPLPITSDPLTSQIYKMMGAQPTLETTLNYKNTESPISGYRNIEPKPTPTPTTMPLIASVPSPPKTASPYTVEHESPSADYVTSPGSETTEAYSTGYDYSEDMSQQDYLDWVSAYNTPTIGITPSTSPVVQAVELEPDDKPPEWGHDINIRDSSHTVSSQEDSEKCSVVPDRMMSIRKKKYRYKNKDGKRDVAEYTISCKSSYGFDTRLKWRGQLQEDFLEAVAELGLKHVTPKDLLRRLDYNGLRRDQVSSHLQKYRVWLRNGAKRGSTDARWMPE